MSISAAVNAHIAGPDSPQQPPLDDNHMQEFEWLRVVESVLADRECSELEITQKELDELIPTLESLELSTDDDDDFSFGNYIHFSPQRVEYPGMPDTMRTKPRQQSPSRTSIRVQPPASQTPRSIPRTEWTRKPGSITPLQFHPPLELKRDPNGGTPRKSPNRRLATKIPVLSSRLGPPVVPFASVDPVKSGLSAFRSNLRNSKNVQNNAFPKIQVFEDSCSETEQGAKDGEQDSCDSSESCESLVNDSSVQFISESCGNDSSVQFIKEVYCDKPPSVSPPSTPYSEVSPSQLGFAANVTQPLRRSRRLEEAELYNEPRSPGRVCSPTKRDFNLKPSLRVSGNQPSSSKLISSLHSALSGSEPLGFYSASDLRARLEGRETRDRFFDGRKRRTRRNQRSVKWAEELEW